MDVMARRRRMLMQMPGLDTSPIIAEYGVNWNRSVGGKSNNEAWCITEWYNFDPTKSGGITIVGYVGNDSNQRTFQYRNENSSFAGWYYFNNGNQEGKKQITGSTSSTILTEISFSIYKEIIDDSYAYVKETGQIFFAGKNSIYYGHKNISELN